MQYRRLIRCRGVETRLSERRKPLRISRLPGHKPHTAPLVAQRMNPELDKVTPLIGSLKEFAEIDRLACPALHIDLDQPGLPSSMRYAWVLSFENVESAAKAIRAASSIPAAKMNVCFMKWRDSLAICPQSRTFLARTEAERDAASPGYATVVPHFCVQNQIPHAL